MQVQGSAWARICMYATREGNFRSKIAAQRTITGVNSSSGGCTPMILDREPVAVSAAVKAVLGALVILGVIHWTDDQVVYVVVALEAVLGVFLRSKVTPTFKVDEKVAEAVDRHDLEVSAFLHAVEVEKVEAECDPPPEVAPVPEAKSARKATPVIPDGA